MLFLTQTRFMDSVAQAQADILRYLIAHIDARDTTAGIEKWWLPPNRNYGLADISAALLELEHRRLIAVWTPASSEAVYGRAPGNPALLASELRALERSG